MGKQLETLSGAVEQVNAKGTGIKVLGEWLNLSQFHPVATMPTPGEIVECQVERTDRGTWITSLNTIGAIPTSSSPTAPSFDQNIRLAVLGAAANFLGLMSQCREEVRSEHVLMLADKWLAWVEENTVDPN
jgi:hypothetical protein